VATSLATGQHVESVPDQDFVDRRRRQLQAMQTMQLMPQALDTETAGPAQIQDQRFFVRSDFR
jgi:hypothetical protein